MNMDDKEINILLSYLDNNLVKDDYMNNNVDNLFELSMDERKKRVMKNLEAYLTLIINFKKNQKKKLEQLMLFIEKDDKMIPAYRNLFNESKTVSRDLEYLEKKYELII